MKSTGEVMAIERTFELALAKAVRSLEQKAPTAAELDDPALIDRPNDRRLFALFHALRQGTAPADLARRSGIDPWFLDRMRWLVEHEADTAPAGRPTYKLVDTCAADFEAETPYFYSCFEEEDESRTDDRPAIAVIGSGPIRIGQGIEFDYCSVHAAWALRESGRAAVMINSNPETVSTDFDTSDRLYFEPLDQRAVADVLSAERVAGAVVQFGGQTAINLADPLAAAGAPILGSSVAAIDLAEDRRQFAAALEEIGVPQPVGDTATSVEAALVIAGRVGYPVLVRPSYVLGGRAMEIVRDDSDLRRYMTWALGANPRGEVLVDKYLQGVEIEVDAISDGSTVVIPGVMQHVERAGVHSGDSYAVYPAPGLEPEEQAAIIDYTIRIARHFQIKGLLNIQFVVHRGHVYVLEVNPRASRTVPFLSKVTGVPMVRLATRVMLGESLADLGHETGLRPPSPLVAVKAPVFSMAKLSAVDSYLGPEMKSTGEVMGIDDDLHRALEKAFLAAGLRVKPRARALLTIADADKPEILPIVSRLVQLGCSIMATEGTAATLMAAGFRPRVVGKIGEEGPNVISVIEAGEVDLVINTMSHLATKESGVGVIRDGFEIRRAAVERRIPCLTSLDTAAALLESAVAGGGRMTV
ncbi:MAG: hypothetical protein NVS9B1_06000 [Candidatus Dormibacteraceae bacterium]